MLSSSNILKVKSGRYWMIIPFLMLSYSQRWEGTFLFFANILRRGIGQLPIGDKRVLAGKYSIMGPTVELLAKYSC